MAVPPRPWLRLNPCETKSMRHLTPCTWDVRRRSGVDWEVAEFHGMLDLFIDCSGCNVTTCHHIHQYCHPIGLLIPIKKPGWDLSLFP